MTNPRLPFEDNNTGRTTRARARKRWYVESGTVVLISCCVAKQASGEKQRLMGDLRYACLVLSLELRLSSSKMKWVPAVRARKAIVPSEITLTPPHVAMCYIK